jgi:hypothetical protein
MAFAGGRLTKVNVVALDRQGQFVAGMRSADFQIQENGKARKIVFFRFTGDTSAQPGGGGAYSNIAEFHHAAPWSSSIC